MIVNTVSTQRDPKRNTYQVDLIILHLDTLALFLRSKHHSSSPRYPNIRLRVRLESVDNIPKEHDLILAAKEDAGSRVLARRHMRPNSMAEIFNF